jgi:hypothetical protein
MMNDEEPAYELVMPFITVQSKGGPHEDDAYVSGYQMGQLDAILTIPYVQEHNTVTHTENVKQADLIGLKHGFSMEIVSEDDTWTTLKFVRSSKEVL